MIFTFKSVSFGILLGCNAVTATAYDDIFLRGVARDGKEDEQHHHRGLASCDTTGLPNLDAGACFDASCTSNDLEIVGATLQSDECLVCSSEQCEPVTANLKLKIRNKTGSKRTAFGYTATLVETLPDGCGDGEEQNVVTCTDERCSDEGVPPNSETELDFGFVTFTCGGILQLVDVLQFWTDASPKSTCDSYTRCKNLSPKCGRPAASIDIEPPLTVQIVGECNADGTQNLEAIVSGGVAPYEYLWSDSTGSTSQSVGPLTSGVTYTVSVTDDGALDCTASDSFLEDCCFFSATCIELASEQLSGCDSSVLEDPTTTIEDIFSDVTTAPCGSLTMSSSTSTTTGDICPGGLSVTRTYTLKDAANNFVSCDQMFMIEPEVSPPTFEEVPEEKSVSCADGCLDDSCFDGPPNAASTVCEVDIISLTNVTDFTMNSDCSDGSTVGTYTITWTAVDECENEASATQTVYVTNDQIPTFFEHLSDKDVECGEGCAESTTDDFDQCFDMPTAVDECGAAVIPKGSVISKTVDGCSALTGTYSQTWTATDKCGNVATTAQTVTIADTTDPTIDDMGIIDEQKTCFDAIDAPPVLIASDTCGNAMLDKACCNMLAVGGVDIMRTWTATDECGNSATFTQDILITCE